MYKFPVPLDPELLERIDKVVELLGLNSREELIRCAIRRFVDKYQSPYIKVQDQL